MTGLPRPDRLAGQVLIAGAGLAGIMTALTTTRPCVVLCAGTPVDVASPPCASMLAQGGLAAAMGADDTVALHAADTLAAGAGLCDPETVARITANGPDAIARLTSLGVAWDRAPDGTLQLGLEAAHCRRRIVHAGEDATGATIMQALMTRVRHTPRITVIEHARALDLVLHDGAVAGLHVSIAGRNVTLPAAAVVLATGGTGGLFADTTNPAGATGSGLAIAARAGAVLGNMEFVQFHPTALSAGADGQRLCLISEAVRGEGAILIDETGARFTHELGTRDSVARAVWQHMIDGHTVYLDARAAVGADFPRHFPAITALCQRHGIDPVTQPIPVRPAAHYHMGGIVVDAQGRTGIPGLWAAGEVACTGLHGANRLASNSLLEAVLLGSWVGQDLDGCTLNAPSLTGHVTPDGRFSSPPPAELRRIMSRYAGVVRTGADLREGLRRLLPHARQTDAGLASVAILYAALMRQESRGGHFRSDHPDAAAHATPSRFTLAEMQAQLPDIMAVEDASIPSRHERVPT
ncbi:L-aspartate oxidase (plasmid) [Komagataeibacter saccharivorans]|uniref:L-aspartate oxidase n=1 Tax=Komagataeibacter saccharivorans TaxID=265959 RepID=UPI001042A169|nr:L-aspartate oxidase [Komagataeibacter saccharivorans]QBL95231.1 L-aspartate oxidase [Komagataeibacter saccharivorans]